MPDENTSPTPEKHGFVIVAPDMRCNNNCLFCYDKDSPVEALESVGVDELVERALAEAARQGIRRVGVSGGEPTIYPGIVDFARRLRGRGLATSILTNGRTLKDAAWLEELLEAGVDHFHVSVHSDLAHEHDAVTRAPGSFDDTLQGLGNIDQARRRRRLDLTIAHVMHRRNYRRLEHFARFIAPFKPYYVLLSYSIVHQASPDDQMNLLAPFETIMPEVLKACQTFDDLGQKVYVDNVPPCMMRGHERICLDFQKTNNLNIIGLKMLGRAEDKRYKAVRQSINSHERAFAAPCADCAIRPYCGGLLGSYAEHFGQPRPRPYSPQEIRDRLSAAQAAAN